MASAGGDCVVIHRPARWASRSTCRPSRRRAHPNEFCILGHFDLLSPDREHVVARWRERPGMLGFRSPSTSRSSRRGGWTARSTGSGRRLRRLVWLSASWPAATWRHDRRSPRVIPLLKLHIDHLGRHGGGAAGKDDAAFANLKDILARAKYPDAESKCRAPRVTRGSPIRTRTFTAPFARSSTPLARSAHSVTPRSLACRARTGNA